MPLKINHDIHIFFTSLLFVKNSIWILHVLIFSTISITNKHLLWILLCFGYCIINWQKIVSMIYELFTICVYWENKFRIQVMQKYAWAFENAVPHSDTHYLKYVAGSTSFT